MRPQITSALLDGGPEPALVGPLGLGALLGSNILVFIGVFSLAPDLPVLRVVFARSANLDLLAELVGAAAGFAFAIGCLVIGRLIVRFGYRLVYLVSLLAFAAAGLGGALTHSLLLIILSRAIVGVASAGIVNAALVAISQLLTPAGQARTLGMQTLVGSLAGILGFPVIGQLSGIDWCLPFEVHLLALAFVPLVLALPSTAASASADAPLPAATGVGTVIIVTAILAGMVNFIGTIFGPLFLTELGVKSPGLLAIPPTAASIGASTGSVVFVFIRRRLGLTGTFAFSLGAMAVGLAITGLSTSVWGVAGGSLVSLIGGGAFAPTLNSAAITASPQNPGPTLGLTNAMFYGSMILFPLIAVPLARATGGSRLVLLGYAGLSAIMAAFFIIGGRLRSLPLESDERSAAAPGR